MLAGKGSLRHGSPLLAAPATRPGSRPVVHGGSCSLARRNRAQVSTPHVQTEVCAWGSMHTCPCAMRHALQALPVGTTVVAPSEDGPEESAGRSASSSGNGNSSSSGSGAHPARSSTSATCQAEGLGAGAAIAGMAPNASGSVSWVSAEPAVAPAPPLGAVRPVTAFDRLAAALAFMLPFSEGMYRCAAQWQGLDHLARPCRCAHRVRMCLLLAEQPPPPSSAPPPSPAARAGWPC